jgi:hypothetical protein
MTYPGLERRKCTGSDPPLPRRGDYALVDEQQPTLGQDPGISDIYEIDTVSALKI